MIGIVAIKETDRHIYVYGVKISATKEINKHIYVQIYMYEVKSTAAKTDGDTNTYISGYIYIYIFL